MYGKAWSVFGKPVQITTQDSFGLYDNQAVYENFGGVVLAKEEGENIAVALGSKYKTCILQNHGLLTRITSLSFRCRLLTWDMRSGCYSRRGSHSVLQGDQAMPCYADDIIRWSCTRADCHQQGGGKTLRKVLH